MALLPQQLPWERSGNLWAAIINPFLGNPTNNVAVLKNIVLATGVNVINHKMGKAPVGWFLTDLNANIVVYRSQPLNDKTLTLTSSGAATVSIGVF